MLRAVGVKKSTRGKSQGESCASVEGEDTCGATVFGAELLINPDRQTERQADRQAGRQIQS
jgi:hypothetical protein